MDYNPKALRKGAIMASIRTRDLEVLAVKVENGSILIEY